MMHLDTAMGTGAAARALSISTQHLHRLIRAGRIKATRTALGYLIDPVEVERVREIREGAIAFTGTRGGVLP